MQLEPAIRNDLIELIAANFRAGPSRGIHHDFKTRRWAGDGGIIAFALRDHQMRAVRFAIELQSTMPVFNLSASGSPTGDIALRLGIDSGRVKLCIETGTIVSDVINHAAHLEKSSTHPETVAVSRVASIFRLGGIFEEKDFFRTIRRLDALLCEELPDRAERPA